MYHQTTSPVKTKYYVPIDKFEEQIKLIAGYAIKGMNTLLTFDDGHKSNVEAARILSKYKLTGVFYIVKDFSQNDSEYMNDDDIREIAAMGHKLGVHGKNHDHWTKKSTKVLVSEIKETKEWLEELTGKKVDSCAAPGGVINSSVVETIRNNFPEFKYFRTVAVGQNNDFDYLVKIVPMHTDTTVRELDLLIKGSIWAWACQLGIYYAKDLLRPICHYVRQILGFQI